jgi:hypothetical protein
MVTKEIKSKVDNLSEEDRAALASYILHGFGAPNYDISDEEVTQRLQDLHSGSIQEMEHDSLEEGLDLRDRR